MDTKFTKHLLAFMLLAFTAGNVFAQDERTWVLDPSTMTPAADGWYRAGGWIEKDGQEVHFSGCEMEYRDSDHHEAGTHEGFEYGTAIVMPDCEGKGTPPREDWPEGYLQLGKHKRAYEDDADFGYIITPTFTNLQSLTILVGTDLSLHSRDIHIVIESSLDGGETWARLDGENGAEGFYIRHNILNQGGDELVYEADGDSPDFNAMVQDSQEQPMKLRIISYPAEPGLEGQRLKIFRLELTATEVEGEDPDPDNGNGPITSVNAADLDTPSFFKVINNTFTADRGRLHVYKISGQLVGSGEQVSIPGRGLYLVKSDKGDARKVFIE